MRRSVAAWMLCALAAPLHADDAAPPDKSGYWLFDPTPDAYLRAFSTDRPPKANSPYTVDAGHFQYETDLAVFGQGNASGLGTRDWTIFDPTLKVGLTNAIDAELQLTPYESVATSAGGRSTSMAGIGDTVARLKLNLLGDDGGDVAVALLPYVKLPTARTPLGNGKTEGGVILPVAIAAPAGFTLIVMPEGDWLADADGSGHHAMGDFLVNVSHPLSARWTAYGELYAAHPFESGARSFYTFDTALTLALTPTLQWDVGGNFALNGLAPRVQIYSGLSQRF